MDELWMSLAVFRFITLILNATLTNLNAMPNISDVSKIMYGVSPVAYAP